VGPAGRPCNIVLYNALFCLHAIIGQVFPPAAKNWHGI
jgi:hypothetical protein